MEDILSTLYEELDNDTTLINDIEELTTIDYTPIDELTEDTDYELI